MHHTSLIACHECDLLQRKMPLPEGGVVRCRRCGGELYRGHPNSLDRALACTFGAIILYVIANLYPIVGLQINGDLVQASLFGAVHVLYADDRFAVSALVFVTTILMPVLQMGAMTYLLLPLRLAKKPANPATAFRIFHLAQEWAMIEVLMLGILVALVKLHHLAAVVPGIALWTFGAFTFLLTAATASFDPHELWAKLEAAS